MKLSAVGGWTAAVLLIFWPSWAKTMYSYSSGFVEHFDDQAQPLSTLSFGAWIFTEILMFRASYFDSHKWNISEAQKQDIRLLQEVCVSAVACCLTSAVAD